MLGRKVEHMVLREMLEHARAAGIRKLTGTYRPTDRNKLVVDHYAKLGFAKVSEDETGLTRWELPVEGAEPDSAPMKVVSQGFAAASESTKASRPTSVVPCNAIWPGRPRGMATQTSASFASGVSFASVSKTVARPRALASANTAFTSR